ncbi:MAG TPA: signal peptidase II [Longimicrobiales bacterium]
MCSRKAALFWPVALAVVLADCGTKRIAESRLEVGEPRPVVGEVVRFTLGYNPGAAFGIRLGDASRVVFAALAAVALVGAGGLYRAARPGQTVQLLALASISGGAAGNLIDRLRSARGVVDFIDVGVGGIRFWTFNVADVGVTLGALLLLASFWRDGESEAGG